MRRTLLLFALMISLLCLAGCGDTAECEEKFFAFRETLSASEELSLSAGLRAEFDGSAADYGLRCSRSGGETVVNIISPVEISGVSARITGEGLELAYDGVILDAGTLTESGLSPLSALPCLLDALQNGYLKLCWSEKSPDSAALVAQLGISDTVWCQVWFALPDMTPTSAELYEGENLVVQCEIDNWTA